MPTQPVPSSIPTNSDRVAALDGLRGLAVVAVMLCHFTSGWHFDSSVGKFACRVLGTGWIGVDLFFVLSGFLITGVLYDAKGSANYFTNFYARRVLRIFPLYYTALAILAIVSAGWHARPDGVRAFADAQHWLWWYGSNIIVARQGGWMFSTEWFSANHFWSLAVEEHFYLLWPMVIATCDRRRAMYVCAGLAALTMASRCLVFAAGGAPHVNYVATFCRLDGLVMGAFVALAWRDSVLQTRLMCAARMLAAPLGFALLGVFVFGEWSRYGGMMQIVGYPTLAMLFTATLVLALNRRLPKPLQNLCEHRVTCFVGKYSYGMYIIHRLIQETVMTSVAWDRISAMCGSAVAGYAAFLVVGFTVTIALSMVSWRLVEEPFLKLKTYFPHRRAADSFACRLA